MNFYDKVNELAKCFTETPEHVKFMELKNKLRENNEVYELVKNFKNMQQECQIELMNTGKINEEKQKKLEEMYNIIATKEEVSELFEYEMKLDVMLADMQKIMGDSVKEIVEF